MKNERPPACFLQKLLTIDLNCEFSVGGLSLNVLTNDSDCGSYVMNMIFVLHNADMYIQWYFQPAKCLHLSGPLNATFWGVSIYQ